MNRGRHFCAADRPHIGIEQDDRVLSCINDNKMLAVGALCLGASELDEAPDRLRGLLELQPAHPRPNSGTGQGQSKSDNRHYNHDFD